MSEEHETAVAEPVVEDAVEEQSQEEKQVPLKALQVERRKRQEAEYQTKWMQEQLQTAQSSQQKKPAEDGDELMTKSDYSRMTTAQLSEMKRQTLEESFLQDHPDIVDAVETDLPDILKKKPWLAHAIANSQNRYKTAHEILQDYRPKGENVRKRIQDNADKPGSPASVGKGGEINRDLSKMTNSEFSNYRKELRAKR